MFNLENYHLKSSSFSDALSSKELSYFKEKAERIEFKKKHILFKEGSFSKGVYIVRKGKIKIYKSNPNGAESIVYIYKKGDYFGYRPLLAEDPNPVSAAAIDNTVVSYLPKEAFLSLFNRSDTLAKKIVITLSQEFSVWINKMTVFTQFSVKERIALSLLILSKVYQNNAEKKVIISINRDDFASFVGTAKESLVRNLRHFKDEKIISTQGTKIVVMKPDQLHAYLL
ncbi:MAG: Crp/Fnr family transcriptional regulator [Bacteroidetes bacterium]|nr:Crp/Fnr family transcriptional regulator [Bacteroidota bacterium]